MSQDESFKNNQRVPQKQIKKRISTKWRKNHRVHLRSGDLDISLRLSDFHMQCLNKYKIDNDLESNTKNQKLLIGIMREWFEMVTIEEARKKPDLMIKLENEPDKVKWIDIIFDHDDVDELEVLRQALDDIIELGFKATSKYKNRIKIKNK